MESPNSDFSVLGMVQNGKLGVENLGKLILRGFRVFRELRVFDLAHLNDPNPPTATSSSNDHNNSTDPRPDNGRRMLNRMSDLVNQIRSRSQSSTSSGSKTKKKKWKGSRSIVYKYAGVIGTRLNASSCLSSRRTVEEIDT